MRLNDSAMLVSGNLPMSSAKIESVKPVEARLDSVGLRHGRDGGTVVLAVGRGLFLRRRHGLRRGHRRAQRAERGGAQKRDAAQAKGADGAQLQVPLW
jgi:hypothetical protein